MSGRLLALGILLLVIAAAWLVVVAPAADAFAEQDAAIAQSHELLAAYARRIALKPVVEDRLAEMKRRETIAAGVVLGGSAELAAANVQNTVKALIEAEGGQVHSAQNLPPVSVDGFQRVDVQYEASVPMARLKDTAYRIETAMPFLFLDGLDLRAPENWQTGPFATDPPNLEVRWTVHGYRWTGAP